MTDRIQPINKFLMLLTLGVFILLIILVYTYRPIRTVSALEGSIEESSYARGFIIRNESIVNAPHDGWIVNTLATGTRVRRNDSVLKYSLEEIDQKNSIKDKETDLQETPIHTIDINSKMDEFQKLNFEGNILEARIMFNQIVGIQETIVRLEPRPSETKVTNSKLISLPTPIPGTISYYTDGLEELLTVNSLKDLDEKLLVNLQPKGKELDTTILRVNAPAYKVFDNLKWYMSLIVPLEDGEFIKGQNVRIYIEEIEDMVTGTVDFFNLGVDNNILVLNCTTQILGLDRLRIINVQIIKNIHRGIKIPIDSIVEHDDIVGVIIKQRGKYIFKEIQVIMKDENNAIIDGIRDLEEVVINPRWVKRFHWR